MSTSPSIQSTVKESTLRKPEFWIGVISSILSIAATAIAFKSGTIVAYGDAESHLNIAKRVVDSLTPGFAQLGGIWLPLPHLLMAPFVWNDFLWRTGLAGSIVSGICFVVSSIFIYKLVYLITRDKPSSFFAAIVFMVNPNILYMQATPMTELPLIAFFILSTYYFIRFLKDPGNVLMIVSAAFFGFCASLSRYDGWALVLMEAGILFLMYFPNIFRSRKNEPRPLSNAELALATRKHQSRELLGDGDDAGVAEGASSSALGHPSDATRHHYFRSWKNLEGILVIFGTLALFGIVLWFAWGWLILGDPLYFTHSQFSAKSQQQSWLARGELPAYGHILVSLQYYAYTSMNNIGIFITELAAVGVVLFLISKRTAHRLYIILVLSVPFIFNVATLYLGQSIIFIPGLTPDTYQWDLFNVRYGMMMVPFAAVFIGFLIYRLRNGFLRGVVAVGVAIQCAVFVLGYAPVLTYADGVDGLSSEVAKVSDAQLWLERNYDHGMILLDDFSRTVSLVHTKIPMNQVIYVGNKPYWDESLKEPEKYATWIVMQKGDALWSSIYDDPMLQGRLFKYFNKVYESKDYLLIFKRIQNT